jgi:hypothetical protein
MLAHIAGVPFEEWVMPFVFSAGAAFVGLRAMVSASRSAASQREGHPERSPR